MPHIPLAAPSYHNKHPFYFFPTRCILDLLEEVLEPLEGVC